MDPEDRFVTPAQILGLGPHAEQTLIAILAAIRAELDDIQARLETLENPVPDTP